jgi:DNA-binding transcriptional LysR family regulator
MVNYTLKQLYSFESVVRLGNFALAARELNITQPAVYMQVKQLQQNIGIDLIVVSGKNVNPTTIGQKFFNDVVKVLAKIEKTNLNLGQLLDPDSGHLTITVATTANSFVSRLLAKFKKQHPKMSFHLEVTNRSTLIDTIKHSQGDLVIMGEPPEDENIVCEKFKENHLIAISNPQHKLANKKQISIDDLATEALITREIDSGTRKTVERLTGLKFNSQIEINSNEAIIEAVRAGLGIGFVSSSTVELELKVGEIIMLDVVNFPIVRHWHLVHQKDKLSPIAKKFKKFIISQANN